MSETKTVTLRQFKDRHQPGTRLTCIDHWIPARIGTERTITRARSSYYECDISGDGARESAKGASYRSPWPKASEVTWLDDSTYRIDTQEHGRLMFWTMRLDQLGEL